MKNALENVWRTISIELMFFVFLVSHLLCYVVVESDNEHSFSSHDFTKFHGLNLEGYRLLVMFFGSVQTMAMSDPDSAPHYQPLSRHVVPQSILEFVLLAHGHVAGYLSLHFKCKSAVTTWFIITIATNTKTKKEKATHGEVDEKQRPWSNYKIIITFT